MNLRDVSPELVDKLIGTYEDIVIVNTDLSEMVARELLAAVLPEYEKQVREQVADEIGDEDRDPSSEYERGLVVAEKVARGGS